MDYGQKQELSPLITLYVDGLRDIVEQSQLEGAEHLLIGTQSWTPSGQTGFE